ncbi:hypothetical protein N7532_000074 [Penicillium argentinense]|uniref:Oligopeptide transporter n=1 Tax=Penicillium argentinense TaxID=1131581 RepID=A0A9W9G4H9_9EURO|nr:uncharacterized protein N7532_000074 [Penicillium argentinense]KAJ5112029.1 hypothetical protein N7532_000074 [Penicillium argentinense]
MNASDPVDQAEVAKSKAISHDVAVDEKHIDEKHDLSIEPAPLVGYGAHDGEDDLKIIPTEEELATLRRVAGKLPWTTFTVAFVELCERFSYYGTTAVFVNFIQRPLPANSVTGALAAGADFNNDVPGALGMGQRASTGLTLFNQFWSYIMPLVGAFVADQYWGRFRTIFASIAVALVGHTILIVSAIPAVISHPGGSIACFSIGLVIMGIGTGGFKSNISPLIAEQYPDERPYIKTLPSGERVIVDHASTVARIYLYFYLMINIGSLLGQISMVYAERYVGFWLSYLLPTIMFCLCPMVLFACRNKYNLIPPTGSVYTQAFRLWSLAMKGRWTLNPIAWFKPTDNDQEFWNHVKPSRLGDSKPAWMTFDDEWVDEVRRGLKACKVFLCGNDEPRWCTQRHYQQPQPTRAHHLHPDNGPLRLPRSQKNWLQLYPLRRITAGFFVAGCSMIAATVTQHYIYKKGPCGKDANYCLEVRGEHTDISVWVQALTYILGGISEIFASVTSLEYAFTKAPRNMRSLVQAVALFMNAISSAIGQALVGLSEDPLLEWNYGITAILAYVGCVGFWLTNYKLDAEEDRLNMLPQSHFEGRVDGDEERR